MRIVAIDTAIVSPFEVAKQAPRASVQRVVELSAARS